MVHDKSDVSLSSLSLNFSSQQEVLFLQLDKVEFLPPHENQWIPAQVAELESTFNLINISFLFILLFFCSCSSCYCFNSLCFY